MLIFSINVCLQGYTQFSGHIGTSEQQPVCFCTLSTYLNKRMLIFMFLVPLSAVVLVYLVDSIVRL